MKTLTVERRYLYALYLTLRQMPPSKFKTVEAMDEVVDGILPVLKGAIGGYIELDEKAAAIRRRFQAGELKQDEAEAQLKVIAKEQSEHEQTAGLGADSVDFENAAFNTLFDLFGEHGKDWLASVEHYVAFRKALNAANGKA